MMEKRLTVSLKSFLKSAYAPYIVPLIVFMAGTYAGVFFPPYGIFVFYPLKTIATAATLYYYRKSYPEITLSFSWLAVVIGIVAVVVWIAPDPLYPHLGADSSFNPYEFGAGGIAVFLIAFRLIGAVIIVPIMEELFWRSFAVRWLIDEAFITVPIGKFTWFSCIATVVGFGFEHHQWLVGLAAGVLYNGLLYYKKDLSNCIVAHAVTNLLLGIYVLIYQAWTFW